MNSDEAERLRVIRWTTLRTLAGICAAGKGTSEAVVDEYFDRIETYRLAYGEPTAKGTDKWDNRCKLKPRSKEAKALADARYRSRVVKPRKGKGSYRRKNRT